MEGETKLCRGCRQFQASWFNLEDPAWSPPGSPGQPAELVGLTVLHNNYAELSACADTRCGLCKYLRREICYYTEDGSTYVYDEEELQHLENSVILKMFWYREYGQRYPRIYLGDQRASERLGEYTRLYLNQWVPLNLNQQLQLARQWLHICCTEHEKCSSRRGTRTTDALLPTRLLDVGSPRKPSLHLVNSDNISTTDKHEYLTLSYCWGDGSRTYCTTKENVQENLRGIFEDALPKTFRDAIEITRALDVRYLWIDALCIIQKDQEDWQREFPNMGKIYWNSLATIAASGAKSTSHGCFYRRGASYWPMQDYVLDRKRRGRYSSTTQPLGRPIMLTATDPLFNIAVENSTLSKRGWALQERLLSLRTLFWTEDGLFWECGQEVYAEHAADRFFGEPSFPQLLSSVCEGYPPEGKQRLNCTTWIDVVEQFSQRALTVATDRLPAIAGLAKEISGFTEQEYIAGVWKCNSVRELAWVATSSTPQAARLPDTPSWSWATQSQTLRFRPHVIGHQSETRQVVTIVSLDAQRLRVRGRLGSINVRNITARDQQGCRLLHPCFFESVRARDDARVIDTQDNRTVIWEVQDYVNKDLTRDFAVLDTLADAPLSDSGSLRCIQWITWIIWTDQYYTTGIRKTGAIVVSPVDHEGKIYRRIGWLEAVEPDFFDEMDDEITLI